MKLSLRSFIHSKRNSKKFVFQLLFKLIDRTRGVHFLNGIIINFNYYLKSYEFGKYQDRKNKILALKNSNSSYRCFILGSGPSVNKQDLSKLRNEFLIAVNQSYLITANNYGFFPNYICLSDCGFYEKIRETYELLPSKIVFSTGTNGKVGINYKATNLAGIIKLNTFKKVWKGNFSINLEKGVYMSNTVIIDLAIPLAIYMGFKEIYLLGCDTEESGYAYKNMEEHKVTKQAILPEVFASYSTVKRFSDNIGVKIINAGFGGKLESFPRVKLEDIL